MKQSGRGYRFLQKIFALPSVKTLRNMLARIPLQTGINRELFNSLTERVKKLTDKEKFVNLLFDEVSLQAGLTYDRRRDTIDSFVDYGEADRRPRLADHAMVFMIRGIYKKFKQPVCFVLSENTVPTYKLAYLIKTVISEVRKTGLAVVATVCDQGSTNQAAINYLLKTRGKEGYPGFFINKEEVVPVYDVPHLLKGLRNNLLTKDAHFIKNGIKRIAQWKHVVGLYEADNVEGEERCLPGLTDEYIYKEKIKKMKISYAAKIFSHRVSTTMRLFSALGMCMSLKCYLLL